jgi:hypothetical protein
MIQKKRRPPDVASSGGPGIDQPRNGQIITPKPARPQAPPLPPDDRGEDDWTFFRARPGAATRTRFALPNEFPADFLEHGGAVAFVRVAVTRDDNGEPAWAARSVLFCSGGCA